VKDSLAVAWAGMPQLAFLWLDEMGCGPTTAGLAGLTRLTTLFLDYTGNQSSRESNNSLLAAAPLSIREVAISGLESVWSQPPPLGRLSQLTRLSCGRDLLPHLGPLGQLRELELCDDSAAALSLEHIEGLCGLTSLQQLCFGVSMPASLGSSRRLQVRREFSCSADDAL